MIYNRKMIYRLKQNSGQIGRPQLWTKQSVITALKHLCKHRYVKASEFSPALYRAVRIHFGSVRRAKYEAGLIVNGRKKTDRSMRAFQGHWTEKKFLKWVRAFCKVRYQKADAWPSQMRVLAVRYFSSIRGAKFAAGVLGDPRKKKK